MHCSRRMAATVVQETLAELVEELRAETPVQIRPQEAQKGP